jgi:hypothetical protein
MGAPKLGPPNVVTPQDNLQEFRDRLPTVKKGEIAKLKEKKARIALFEQWLIDNPIKKQIIHLHYHLAFNFFLLYGSTIDVRVQQ